MTTNERRRFLKQAAALAAAGALPARSFAAAAPFSPRYCICNETFGDWPFEKAFALAAEAGYQGLEIAPFTIDEDVRRISAARRAEVRGQAAAAGLTIVGLHWLLARTKGLHLTSPDAQVRQATAEYLGDLARFCADLGGNLLVFGSPQQRSLPEGVSREQGLAHAAEVIQRALPVLETTDVTLALEPLSPKITNFLTNADEAAMLMERVASPRCRLNLDCLAMAAGESQPIPEVVRRHAGTLVHFHTNDPNSQGPGFGELDFVPILASLREVEYRGWLSVEVFDYKPGPEQLARESIAYLKKCLAASGGG